eukprot:TRINITY_DN1908_c0_g1_i2.p1 TRINITY_DN1908_c0_g1~~TRINITY_DN1908_c0_g1_i2.p1  ORF type:complete len:433 (+),score=116.67 TRINITY_DN1908_c0_g1_i2:112-1410(+)
MKSKSFHLKWSSHFPNMEKVLAGLVSSESLTDVSLVCSDGRVLKSHRLVLSSSSDFLHGLFMDSLDAQPVLFLPDMDPEVLSPLLHFIYTGEILVEEEDILRRMLELSEALCIKGLDVALEERERRLLEAAQALAAAAAAAVVANTENMGNKRKTRSPRQVIMTQASEEPRDLRSRTDENMEHEVLRDRVENGLPDESIDNDECPPSKMRCLEESSPGGGPWPQVFPSSMLAPRPLEKSNAITIKQEDIDGMPPPVYPLPNTPLSINSEHISNILNTSTVPICPLCGKDCANFPNLRTHLQNHNNSKPFACDFCDSKFTRAAHLSRHRRSHTGEKPFECSICGKLFSRQDKLKVHVDRHRIREEKEMMLNKSKTSSQQIHQSTQQPHWNVNATFPSQVSPYPSHYYDHSTTHHHHVVPKNEQQPTIMQSFIG